MAIDGLIFKDGDTLTILGRPYVLNLKDAPTILKGTDDPGACVEREKIYIRLGRGDPKETLIHEIQEAVKYEMLEAAQNAMDDLIHREGGEK